MLIDVEHTDHTYVICGATDMRKSIEGCMGIVSEAYHLNPVSSSLFLFCNKKKTTLKVLHFDVNGFEWLIRKPLEGKFQWPKIRKRRALITKRELRGLFEGLSLGQINVFRKVEKKIFKKNQDRRKTVIDYNPMPEVEFNFSLQDFEKMLNFMLTATAYSAKIRM